ncbi:DMT family transporter [Aquincola sp. MAHUQ-54]|uniref:DMT family transporter n=1 Tax=Aquincola agrisoli TaxID=3119538 RepID=A0AAW9QBH2_9BURK
MRPRDLLDLTMLAALWGAAFLFMRMGAAAFGPVALAAVRVGGAACFLLPLLAWRRELPALRAHWRPVLAVGVVNSALPFLLFSYAALAISAGLSSIFNATAPLWAALVARVWLKDKLPRSRVIGLAIGFAGVAWLAWDKASLKPGDHGVSPAAAIAACLLAAFFYGLGASCTKRWLTGVPLMPVAAGSQLGATLSLALPAALAWPAQPPAAGDWAAAAMLAVLCTGVAYLLFFRLIANVGPANAITVTFLIPAFAVLWGWMLLGEPLTGTMVAGCAVILLGTSLATGVLPRPR